MKTKTGSGEVIGSKTTSKFSVRKFGSFLKTKKSNLAAILPRTMNVERFIRLALAACVNNPDLLKCTRESLYLAVYECATLGLEIGVLDSAWIIPFGKKAVAIPGYRGLVDLARRGGDVATIETRIVKSEDTFRVTGGTSPGIEHEINLEGQATEKNMVAVYAVATLRTSEKQFEVMTKKQVDEIRARSKAANKGPWVTDYLEMARKTVIRRIIKSLPISVETASLMTKALEMDNKALGYRDELLAKPETIDVESIPPESDESEEGQDA